MRILIIFISIFVICFFSNFLVAEQINSEFFKKQKITSFENRQDYFKENPFYVVPKIDKKEITKHIVEMKKLKKEKEKEKNKKEVKEVKEEKENKIEKTIEPKEFKKGPEIIKVDIFSNINILGRIIFQEKTKIFFENKENRKTYYASLGEVFDNIKIINIFQDGVEFQVDNINKIIYDKKRRNIS